MHKFWWLNFHTSIFRSPDDPAVNPPVLEDDDDPADPVPRKDGKYRDPTEYEKRLRTEAAGHRKARREAEAEAKGLKESWTTREAAIRAEALTAAEAKANGKIIKAELKVLAKGLGMIDLDGLSFVDMSKLTLDDKEEVIGGAEALEGLKKAKPYLFGVQETSTSTQKPPKPGDPAPKDAKDMSPEEFKAAKAKAMGR